MKRTYDKAQNVFKKHNSVTLTKSSDKDKSRLHEYYLHSKERIRQQYKDYYNNNNKRIRDNSKNNRKKQKISLNNLQGRVGPCHERVSFTKLLRTTPLISVTHVMAILRNSTFQLKQSAISCRYLRPYQK